MSRFDVFISFRNSDDSGARTTDYQMASELYTALTKNGVSVFFSPISIKQNAVSNYSQFIDDAIEQSDILIAVGTSVDNLKSRWVYYEIDSFRNELNNGNKDVTVAGMISYISPNVNVNKLPMCLRRYEAFTNLADIVEWVCNRKRSRNSMLERFIDRGGQLEFEDITTGSTILDHYKISSMLGKGGISTVYLAFDEMRGRSVAIKITKKGKNTQNFETIIAGFKAELDLLKRFHNPHLPQIYDAITKPDMMLIIMDYIDGEPLERILKEQGPIHENEVIDLGKGLCDILDYLHTLNPPVIYRDMKPGNIMVRSSGEITLIDFGTAREYKPTNTADTICLGTVGYAAPEQFGGMGQTDCRTDIYGLGVTLYQAVTGINPSEPPYEIRPIRTINPALSLGLEYIIEKCVKRDPAERYQSAKDVLFDLNNIDRIEKRQKRVLKRLIGTFSRSTRSKKNGKNGSETSCVVISSVPESLRKRGGQNVGDMTTSYADLGSFGTTVLSGSDAISEHGTLRLDDLVVNSSARDLLRKINESDIMCDTCELNSPVAVCVLYGFDRNDATYYVQFYILTKHSKSKVIDIMKREMISRDILMDKIPAIPCEKVLSASIQSEKAEFVQHKKDYLWDSDLCYGKFTIASLHANSGFIPVKFCLRADRKELFSVSFDIKLKK